MASAQAVAANPVRVTSVFYPGRGAAAVNPGRTTSVNLGAVAAVFDPGLARDSEPIPAAVVDPGRGAAAGDPEPAAAVVPGLVAAEVVHPD